MRTPPSAPPLWIVSRKCVVAGRGGETPSPSKALAGTVHVGALALRPLWHTDDQAIAAAGINGGQAVAFGRWKIESGVLHAQRPGDPGAHKLVERHAGRLLHHATQDVGVVTVYEGLAGLRDQGKY